MTESNKNIITDDRAAVNGKVHKFYCTLYGLNSEDKPGYIELRAFEQGTERKPPKEIRFYRLSDLPRFLEDAFKFRDFWLCRKP